MELVDEIFVPSDKDAEYAKACVRTLARGFAVDSRVTMQREDDSEAIAGDGDGSHPPATPPGNECKTELSHPVHPA